jgi:small subunit ribosomal protein S6
MVMIISPELPEEDLGAVIDKVSDLITSKGGEMGQIDRWGKKKMAYPIERFKEGNYVLSRFKFEPGMTAELESDLNISENILRHMLIRLGS